MDSDTSATRIQSEEPLLPLQTHQEEVKVLVNEGEGPPSSNPFFPCSPDQEMASLGDHSASGFSGVVQKIETLCLESQDSGISEVGFVSNGGGSTRKLERGSCLKEKTFVEGVLDVKGGILGRLRGIGADESVEGSLKIEVIDDTALVIPVGVFKSKSRGGHKKKGKKMCENGGENDGRKAKPRYQRKRHHHGNEKHSCIGGAGKKLGGDGAKVKYSRGEMESLRFVNVVEQRKMWKGIYTGLEASVRKGYDDLASSKHQKQKIASNFDPRRQHQRPKDDGPGILGPVAGWGRLDHLNVYVH